MFVLCFIPDTMKMQKINDVFFQIGSKTIYVNGEERTLESPAYILNTGNTMLPLRDMVSAILGEDIPKIHWNSDKKIATILYNEILLNISLGSRQMEKNGVLLDMGKEMELINNCIFVPLRDICAAFDIEERIDWNVTEKTLQSMEQNETILSRQFFLLLKNINTS